MRLPALALGIGALALAACGGGGGGLGGTGGAGGLGGAGGPTASTLRILVTDAPFNFDYVESASVVIQEVSVHEKDSDAWTTVFTGSQEIDLVPLTNGVSELLVAAEIEPGTYDKVRLIVDAGTVVLTEDAVVDGDSHVFDTEAGNLLFPSGAQTGIKVDIDDEIVVVTSLSSDLLLDFDLSRNFVFNGPVTHAPGVKRVIFTPHVRASNVSTQGSLTLRAMSDQLTPETSDDIPLSGATVSVFTAGDDPLVDAPVASTLTDEAGQATVSLLPGTYDVFVEADGHDPATVAGAVVVLANLTDLGDVVLAANGMVSGVVSSDGGTPLDTADDLLLAGATVEVRRSSDSSLVTTVATDASGFFEVPDLEAGDYDLTISATGFETLSVPAVAATIGGAGTPYLLHALPTLVHGTVTVAGEPAVGATVEARNAADVLVASTTTAEDGTYSLTLGTGSYTIVFTAGAETTSEAVVLVGADPAADLLLDVDLP
jgi:hypothetical protein